MVASSLGSEPPNWSALIEVTVGGFIPGGYSGTSLIRPPPLDYPMALGIVQL